MPPRRPTPPADRDAARLDHTVAVLTDAFLRRGEHALHREIGALPPCEAAYVAVGVLLRVSERQPEQVQRLRQWLRIFAACETTAERHRESGGGEADNKPSPSPARQGIDTWTLD